MNHIPCTGLREIKNKPSGIKMKIMGSLVPYTGLLLFACFASTLHGANLTVEVRATAIPILPPLLVFTSQQGNHRSLGLAQDIALRCHETWRPNATEGAIAAGQRVGQQESRSSRVLRLFGTS